MRRLVGYEWKVEWTDADGYIHDVDHQKKLDQRFVSQEPYDGLTPVICLVRNEYDPADPDDLLDRFHWYPGENGQDGGNEFTPPKKYRAEADKFGLTELPGHGRPISGK